jgi:carboxyl-terminal processing protease
MRRQLRTSVGAALLVLSSATIAPAALSAQDSARVVVRPRTTYEDLQLFSQVFNQIRVNHPDTLDSHALIMAAIRGMVRAADPHSYVMPSVRLAPELEELQRAGKLTPLPVAFTFVGGSPVVVSVAPGTKAAQQDIVIGDELLAVDGKAVGAEGAEELELALSGAPGSAATLMLERHRADGARVRIERRVVRQHVDESTAVPVAILLDSATGYVRVTSFANSKVADDLHEALGRLESRGMKRLILDLRDNGGGIVAQAARVAGEFLPAGAVVYSSIGRKKEVIDTGRVKRSFWRSERRYPIVVMVNQGTASASELVAGALQDHDRALIIGRATFGKALLMQGFPLTDGSMIMLVVGQVRTPCGRVVQRAYRNVSSREYYRLAGEARDTIGRPSCTTDRGRVVYGGGGVYPDIILPEPEDPPTWVARLNEADVWLEWLGSYLTGDGARLTTLDAFLSDQAQSPSAIAGFRALAARHEVVIPADADALLWRFMRRVVAGAKWGEAGALTLRARSDPQIRSAMESFARAAELLGPGE